MLKKLIGAFKASRPSPIPCPALPQEPTPEDANSTQIVQSWIWKRLGSFSRSGDILIAESGTAQFGFPDATLPADMMYITQVYYGSIGYSVGSCLGAAIAQKQIQEEGKMNGGRTILVVGDGSLLLTVQEIGTMIKLGINPIMYALTVKFPFI